MNRARIEREYLPFQSFLIAWPTSQKLGEEERWPRNVSIDTPIRLVWGAAHPPSLLSPRNRNLASSLLVSAAGKQSEYSLLAVSEEQISPVYALDGSRRLSRERLTCLETSSCACVCVSLHITRREINQSVEISSRVWLEELPLLWLRPHVRDRAIHVTSGTLGNKWRRELPCSWEGRAEDLLDSGKTDPLENRDWW